MLSGIFGDNTHTGRILNFGISRARESHADLLGLKLLYGVGLPRTAIVDLLNLLAAQGSTGLTWLSARPESSDRAAAADIEPLPSHSKSPRQAHDAQTDN